MKVVLLEDVKRLVKRRNRWKLAMHMAVMY